MKNLLLIAAPAGGKGTISSELEKDFGYVHISTGDLIREIDETTPLGQQVKACMDVGAFVDDNIVLSLLKEKILTIKNKPFVLEGFPRSIKQAKELEEFFEELNISLDMVIFIDVSYDTALKRSLGRVTCPNCHESFNIYFKKPKIEDVCDKCGTRLIKRSDDTEETFKNRYETFQKLTLPLLEFYEKKGILKKVGEKDTYNSIVSEIQND